MIWGQFIVLSLAVAVAAMTITKSQLFERFRWWLEDKAYYKHEGANVYVDNEPFYYLHELFICPYCLSHWISFLFVAIYQPRILHSGVALIDYFVEALALTALATFWGAVIVRAYLVKNDRSR